MKSKPVFKNLFLLIVLDIHNPFYCFLLLWELKEGKFRYLQSPSSLWIEFPFSLHMWEYFDPDPTGMVQGFVGKRKFWYWVPLHVQRKLLQGKLPFTWYVFLPTCLLKNNFKQFCIHFSFQREHFTPLLAHWICRKGLLYKFFEILT